MKNKININPLAYLRAAELQVEYTGHRSIEVCQYSFDNLIEACRALAMSEEAALFHEDLYIEYFAPDDIDDIETDIGELIKHYDPSSGSDFDAHGWGDEYENGEHILALLFMYEIAKDLVSKKTNKKPKKKP